MKQLSDAAILTMLNGGRYDPDQELVYDQHKERQEGHIYAKIIKNIYGFCLFDAYSGGRRISENFKIRENAEIFASEWVNDNTVKHHLYIKNYREILGKEVII